MNGKSTRHKMTKREEVIHHYVLFALKENPTISLAVIGAVNNAFMDGMLAYEQQHEGEEAASPLQEPMLFKNFRRLNERRN